MDYGSGVATSLIYGILVLFGFVALLFFLLIAMRLLGRRRERSLELKKEAARPIVDGLLSGAVDAGEAARSVADGDSTDRLAFERVLLEYANGERDEYRPRILELSRSMGFVAEDIENVEKGSDAKCAQSARHLGIVGAREAVPALVDALEKREDPDVVFACLKSLTDIGYPESVGAVKTYLQVHPEMQNARLAELMLKRREDFVPFVVEGLEGDAGPERSLFLLKVAGAMGNRDLVDEVVEYLSSGDARLRAAAAHALGRMGRKEACSPLTGSLGDEDPGVRAEAAEGLGKSGCAGAIESLEAGLHDTVVEVKRQCAVALTMLGEEGRRALERGLSGEREDSSEVVAEVMDHERVRRDRRRES